MRQAFHPAGRCLVKALPMFLSALVDPNGGSFEIIDSGGR